MRIYSKLALIVLALFFAVPELLWAVAPATVTLVRGRNQDVSPGYTIGRTAIGDPGVCDFIIPEGRNSIVLVPKAQGTTNLILYDTNGTKRDTIQITVVPDLSQLATNLADSFANIAGLDIAIRNNRVVISGSVFSDKDYQLIQDTIRPLGDAVFADIRLDPEAIKLLADEIERAIGRQEIHTRVVRDKILLEGFAFSEGQQARAEQIAKSLAADRVVNVVELKKEGRFFRDDKMVHFDVKFVEMRYQDLKDWGLNWGDAISTDGTKFEYTRNKSGSSAATTTQNLSVVSENFLPNLNILVQEGVAKLLLNPRIICKNGETAREVVDGGELPVITVNRDNVTINYKEFGVTVEVAPLVDKDDNVDTNIKTIVLFPSQQVELQGVIAPSFTKEEVATNVILKKGQTLVLSGVISNRMRRSFSGWPFLSKIPLIRHFFGTRQLDLNKTEIVLFVTPTVLNPGDASPDMDTRLQQKLEFDMSVEPKFSVDYSHVSGGSQ